MKKFAFLSATALLLVACAANEVQFPGVSPSPVLNISNSSGSFVGKKVNEFTREYNNIHSSVNSSAQKLAQINQSIAEADSEYNAVINTIEAKLQAGTTPSNPDLVSALNKAQENLGTLENGTQKLASVASEVAAQQEKLSALKSTVSATYAIPGAYDVDHADLNIISSALEQQENTNADLMAAVKADMADEQSKAQQFRAEITRLNVDVAAGYANKTAAAVSYDSRTNFKTIKPVQIKKELAKDKSVRTNKKRVKLGKKFGIIENTPKTSPKAAVSKPAATKASSAKKATPQSVQKALNTAAPQQAKTIAEPVKPIAGTIFSKDFPDDNVEYYAELSNAVQNALKNNPDARFEVVAIMPMDTAAQERIQNVTAQIFGDMLTMSVPAENLQVSARSEISKKTPTVAVIKK
ncbi:MAG TPA: hypothetical protein DD619_04115 [Alphaproteobacteria bacterium]|nr:hypothetical protein [Alphaproteobacteria bacterium]